MFKLEIAMSLSSPSEKTNRREASCPTLNKHVLILAKSCEIPQGLQCAPSSLITSAKFILVAKIRGKK